MHLVKDDVVISGIGGYFPRSLNIEEFANNLFKNEMLLDSRWSQGERGVTNLIGKVPSQFFDNAYFGIHRQQSTFMDPMQRLIMERTFEALMDAGVSPTEIRGKRIGCFMGSAIGENDNLFLESVISGFGVTGHSRAMMPNRISYWLNLKGPSVAYDSNWVSGIEVLRLGFEAIKSGQCESVIIGTANLALNSEFQWLYNDMGLISSDGSTKAFDADAEGYARSDGVVVMYLEKASEAKRHYASVLNAATRFDGNREGTLLDIDVDNMAEFINEFYSTIDVDPSEVEFVETYGCALKETDKKELEALEKVYCKNRKSPLLVGSVKTNTGHSEASAAMFSIAKAIIALETETIPATLQYKTPNPEIKPLVNGTIQVVTENRKWGAQYVAVNAIGLDSYYGHVLLRGNPKKKVLQHDGLPRLVIASTRTEDGIKEIFETVKSRKEFDVEYFKLIQDLFSKPILGHLYRGYAILDGENVKQETEYHMGNKRQTWFVYSGMGSQWAGMVNDLMNIPVFANAINKCCKVLEPKGIDLMDIISNKDPKTFDSILHSFVGIAAIQIALTDCLTAIGIVPDGIIGHSVGELGCAYADGCMTAEQMILSAYSRGKASLESTLIKGMMAAVGMGYQQIKNKCPPTIEVACHNGPDSATISGPTEDMEKFVKELQEQGIFARLVNVSNIAYHSRYIKPAAPRLLEYLKQVLPTPVERSSKWISTSNLEENWDTDLAKHSSPEYHTNNLLSSVLFEEGLKHIPKDSVLIEIAPHGLLQAILKRSLKSGCTNIALTQRGTKSGVEFMLTAIGKLYLAGLNMNISKLYPNIDYPVSRGTPCLANLAHWEHSEEWNTGLEDKYKALFGVRDFQLTLNSEEFRDCVGHQLDDKIILPIGSQLNIIASILSHLTSTNNQVIFENLYFKKALAIPRIGSVAIHTMIQKGSGNFEILAGNDMITIGHMYLPDGNDKILIQENPVVINEDGIQLTGSDVYNEFQHRGHKYSGSYKCIKQVTLGEKGMIAVIQWNNNWNLFLEGMLQLCLLQNGERSQQIFYPKNIQKIIVVHNLLPTEKKDLTVTYNYSTGLISTEGIQIIGLKATKLVRDSKPISYDSLDFVPLNYPQPTSIENCINTALQLTIDNFHEQFVTNITVTEMETENPSLIENVKNVFNQYTKLNPNITSVKDSKMLNIQNTYPTLIIVNDIAKDDILKLIASTHGFLLTRTDKSLLTNPQIVQVAQLTVDNISYSIVRKATSSQPTIIKVKGDTLSIKDLTRGSVSWVSELEAAVSSKNKQGSIYLVSSLLPSEGILNFTHELLSSSKFSSVRLLFNFDKKLEDLNSQICQEIFKKDLNLNVIKDGQAGTIIPIPLKFNENLKNNLNVTSNMIKNTTICYIGINPNDETILPPDQKKNELGNLDYAGILNSGEKVMGLAQMNREVCMLTPDPILTWTVSDMWNLEDAATLPHAYASAYYILDVKANIQPGEIVLVHGGWTPVGLAIIAVASLRGCTVYTTVATDWQRSYLKKTFSVLRDHNIMSALNTNFEPLLLMATGGVGAHVIVNCLPGNLLQASVSCLADYGRFIQIGKFDLIENNSIGMNVFLRNTSFYVVDLVNIVNLPVETKEEIKKLMEDGMNRMVVRPLLRKVVDHQNVSELLSMISNTNTTGKVMIKINNSLSLNNFILDNPNQFICDPKCSYLVYGGSAELWADAVEWLVLRGGRKIVVSSDSKPQQLHINRRLTLLQNYYNAEIVFTSCKTHTREGASELLSEVYFLGPIHVVMLLPNKNNLSRVSDIKPIQYIDNALRTTAPKAILINFINSASGMCQIRSDAGFCTYNIQWEKGLDFIDALDGLDDILVYKVKDIMIKNDRISDITQETSQALFKKLTLILPSSLENLVNDTTLAPLRPKLKQLPTLGPKEMRELAPVFIIPGISGLKECQELALKLLYPTFCAVIPSTPLSIKEMAADLAEQFKKVWPKRVFNIIAISWGGALAIEIARILSKENKSLHLYFIDGAPNTIQSAIKYLGNDTSSLETNLLTRILSINDNELISKITEANSWEIRMKIALDNYEGEAVDRKVAEDGLSCLRKRLLDVSTFQPTDELVTGKIHLLRPFGSSKYDNCGLVSYCKQTPEITLVNGDHLSIINNSITSGYINEKHYLI